ncbi:MAG TPA: hypothetical protein VF021_01830 [Longimicrobiales bacterium]
MKRVVLALATLLITACSEHVASPPQQAVSTSDLTFLRFQPAAYAAAQKSASFWAVKGQERGVALRFGDTGAEFMRFTVGANALSTRPDGSPFLPGDSVLISVSVDASARILFNFQPSGLKFSDAQPAQLHIDYARADADVNADGVVDVRDAVLLLQAAIWKQELPGLPWLKLPTIGLSGDAAQSDIHDFTGFGMAVN